MVRSRYGAFADDGDITREELIRVKAAVDASGDVAYDWDLRTDTITWSGAGSALSPFIGPAKITTGAKFLRGIVPEDAIVRRRALASHLQHGEPFDCEYRVFGTGNGIWLQERGCAQFSHEGKPLRLVGTLRIVTARKETEARLKYEAQHDVLTGLFNRTSLCDELDEMMALNRRHDRGGFYLAIGIDRLTIINNAFGHEAGDAVLFDLSQRLEMRPPIGDAIGRVGGDCFGVAVAAGDSDAVDIVAERILDQMRAAPIETPHGPVFVTASIGATLFGPDDRSPQDIMAKADVALREAKRGGRDRYFNYSEADFLRQGHREYAAVAERVRAALAEDRLTFAYQPIIDAEDGAVCHYECLLRMIDTDGALVAAGRFMPIIEEMGLVRHVDRHVLEMALDQLALDDDVVLAINVSGLTACDSSWLDRLIQACEDRADLARRLIIEITETVAIRDIDESACFVNAVRALGCQVALDDFGAGYTSFKNLRALNVDVVKIDGSFVRDVALNKDNQLFIKSLVGLARGFGLQTVAECVESQEDAGILQQQGVDYLQGYTFGRPETDRPWVVDAARESEARAPKVGKRLVDGTARIGV